MKHALNETPSCSCSWPIYRHRCWKRRCHSRACSSDGSPLAAAGPHGGASLTTGLAPALHMHSLLTASAASGGCSPGASLLATWRAPARSTGCTITSADAAPMYDQRRAF